MEQAMNAVSWTRTVAFLSLAVAAAVTHAGAKGADNLVVDHVRSANERFTDVAVAIAEGYASNGCATSLDGGAMGVRYVNAAYLKDEQVDIKRPQVVLYEPLPGGKLALVAVQHMTFKGPTALEGQAFGFVGAPNHYELKPFYELPVWAWKANPRGAFVEMNPRVSCDYAETRTDGLVIFDLD
jgi:hypothetical protein